MRQRRHEPPGRHAVGEAQPWDWGRQPSVFQVSPWPPQWELSENAHANAIAARLLVFIEQEHVRFFEVRLGLQFAHWRLLNRCGQGTSRRVVRYQGE